MTVYYSPRLLRGGYQRYITFLNAFVLVTGNWKMVKKTETRYYSPYLQFRISITNLYLPTTHFNFLRKGVNNHARDQERD